MEVLKYLRHFQRSSYREASRARSSLEVRAEQGRSIQKEAEILMQGYFTYLLERELNTPGFIKRVKEK
jgi:DNA repair protein RecO (recombination protein O)